MKSYKLIAEIQKPNQKKQSVFGLKLNPNFTDENWLAGQFDWLADWFSSDFQFKIQIHKI
jgi:hypothetical protein